MKNSISLSKFLSRYVSLEGKDLKKVTHKEVKALFPFLKRAGFEDVSNNPILVKSGKVVLVDDGHNEIYYYVPERTEEDKMQFTREEVDKRIVLDDTVYDYVNMSVYELRCLLVRKFNSTRNQYCARRELNRRGIPITRKYKRVNKIINEND